jgi:hypothetical protein
VCRGRWLRGVTRNSIVGVAEQSLVGYCSANGQAHRCWGRLRQLRSGMVGRVAAQTLGTPTPWSPPSTS